MRYRFIFLIGLLLIINSAFAQWHYTITSQSFYGGCGSISATIYVSVYEQSAINAAAQTYNSQADCEQARREWGMINYSSGGCYARVTSSPCQGNTGGIGATGIYYGEQSLYNSLGTEGFTFSPTEQDINQNTYEEYIMRQQAFGYNSGNAQTINPNMMSAKTGDNDFDNLYTRQIRSAYDRDNNDKSDIVLRKVRNKSIQDDNLQTTKFKARIQQHINNRLRPKNKQFNVSLDNSGAVLSDVYDDIKVGSKVIKEGNKELVGLDFLTNEIKKYLGILDDAEKSSEIGFDLADGNRDEAASKFYSLLKDKMIDPATDFIANSFGDNWTKMIKNIVTFAKFNSKETPGLAKRTFNRISEANRTGDYKKLDRENNKEMARFGYKVNKTTKKMIKN